MSGNREPTSDLPEPSDVRFGMRGLLLTMTAVAVVTAVLGSTVRRLDSNALANVMVVWGIAAVIVVCRVAYCAWTRVRLERSAGRILCTLSPRGVVFRWPRSAWMSVMIGLLWIGGGVYFLWVAAILAGGSDPSLFPGIVSGALISIGIAAAWWNRAVQIRENGVLHGLRLLRWTHITKHSWKDEALSLEGVDQRHRDMQMAAVANAASLDAAKRVVERKISPAGWLGLEAMLGQGLAYEKAPLVPIQSHSVTMQGLMSAFVAYVLFSVLFALTAFHSSAAPSREFVRGVFYAIGAALVLLAVGSRRVREAGGPIVRLKRRSDLPSTLVAFASMFVAYYISQRLVFPHFAIGMSLGAIAGIGASLIIGMVSRDKIDLCKNGVVIVRWTFLPWKSVRLLKWNRDGNGKLLIRSGWRRLAAKVPIEHREIVDHLLQEKAGRGAPSNGEIQAAATSHEP